MRPLLRRLRFLLVALALGPGTAAAQAWLPEEGTLSYGVSFTDTINRNHYLPNGDEVDVGHTRSQTAGFYLTYSPSRRWMVAAALPYVSTRFWGERPHPAEIDNGDTHSSFTDLRLSVHYQALDAPVSLAPYLGVVVPTNDYPTFGHAAPGRGLYEAWFGFAAGKNLDPWIPRTYAQLRYNYAWVERVAGIAHDRSNLDLELGFFVLPTWSIRLLGFWQETHGGVDVPMPPSNPLYPYHDQLADESFFNAGFGTSVALSSRTMLYASYQTGIHGRNGHKVDHGVLVGLSFGFMPER